MIPFSRKLLSCGVYVDYVEFYTFYFIICIGLGLLSLGLFSLARFTPWRPISHWLIHQLHNYSMFDSIFSWLSCCHDCPDCPNINEFFPRLSFRYFVTFPFTLFIQCYNVRVTPAPPNPYMYVHPNVCDIIYEIYNIITIPMSCFCLCFALIIVSLILRSGMGETQVSVKLRQ